MTVWLRARSKTSLQIWTPQELLKCAQKVEVRDDRTREIVGLSISGSSPVCDRRELYLFRTRRPKRSGTRQAFSGQVRGRSRDVRKREIIVGAGWRASGASERTYAERRIALAHGDVPSRKYSHYQSRQGAECVCGLRREKF